MSYHGYDRRRVGGRTAISKKVNWWSYHDIASAATDTDAQGYFVHIEEPKMREANDTRIVGHADQAIVFPTTQIIPKFDLFDDSSTSEDYSQAYKMLMARFNDKIMVTGSSIMFNVKFIRNVNIRVMCYWVENEPTSDDFNLIDGKANRKNLDPGAQPVRVQSQFTDVRRKIGFRTSDNDGPFRWYTNHSQFPQLKMITARRPRGPGGGRVYFDRIFRLKNSGNHVGDRTIRCFARHKYPIYYDVGDATPTNRRLEQPDFPKNRHPVWIVWHDVPTMNVGKAHSGEIDEGKAMTNAVPGMLSYKTPNDNSQGVAVEYSRFGGCCYWREMPL